MTAMFRKGIYYSLLSSAIMLLAGCEDNDISQNTGNDNGQSDVRFYLTDAPATYDEVWIDIQEVRVHIGDDTTATGWFTLDSITPGRYDLLQLQNGLDTVLAQDQVPAGKLTQIRLILGPNNEVVKNGVTHSLKTPSAQQSGLKLLVNYTLQAGLYYEFWLDFDAQRSIVETGNGMFLLKPVIKVFTQNSTGSIAGYIDPPVAYPLVWAYNAQDTVTARADSTNGYFLLKGLDPGVWDVETQAGLPYSDTTVTGVNVTQGQVSNLDTLKL